MDAIALVTDSVIGSPLKDYLKERCASVGMEVRWHSVTGGCQGYRELFKQYPNVITWNCRMTQEWMTRWGNNVLFVENALLKQPSGIFIDGRGFFSNSNLRAERTWTGEKVSYAQAQALDKFVRQHFQWKPFGGSDANGPILVCLQFGPDCNLQQEFALGKGHEDKVKATLALVKEYLPKGRKVIIRPHPRYLPAWQEKEAEYRRDVWREDWEVNAEGSVYELLPKCAAMVAVNSTTVSEALSLAMPVATLGTGYFSGVQGLTLECAGVPERLQRLLDWKPDAAMCERYVNRILTRHHLPFFGLEIEHRNEQLEGWLAKAQASLTSPPAPLPRAERGVETPKHLGGHAQVTHVDEGALAWLRDAHGVATMVDIGCGPGGMEGVAQGLGIKWRGIDGDPAMARRGVLTHDYTVGRLELSGCYDLAWSTEFLEHVSESYLPNFMATFQAARVACVTHALPGKKGWHHVNCQPPEYWRRVFEAWGFRYDEAGTAELRVRSTMKREFVRNNGLMFRKA